MTKEVIFYTNFLIRRVVKFGDKKKIKHFVVWDGLSSKYIVRCYRTNRFYV